MLKIRNGCAASAGARFCSCRVIGAQLDHATSGPEPASGAGRRSLPHRANCISDNRQLRHKVRARLGTVDVCPKSELIDSTAADRGEDRDELGPRGERPARRVRVRDERSHRLARLDPQTLVDVPVVLGGAGRGQPCHLVEVGAAPVPGSDCRRVRVVCRFDRRLSTTSNGAKVRDGQKVRSDQAVGERRFGVVDQRRDRRGRRVGMNKRLQFKVDAASRRERPVFAGRVRSPVPGVVRDLSVGKSTDRQRRDGPELVIVRRRDILRVR